MSSYDDYAEGMRRLVVLAIDYANTLKPIADLEANEKVRFCLLYKNFCKRYRRVIKRQQKVWRHFLFGKKNLHLKKIFLVVFLEIIKDSLNPK